MSRFMVTIDWPGLIESPPLSKVMPLPTSTTWRGLARRLFGGLVVELHEARRGGGGLADADDAAEAALGELLLVEDGGLEPGRLGGGDGLLGQPGRGLDVGGHARQQPGLPAGAGDRHGPTQPGGPVLVVLGQAEHDLAGRPVLGSVLVQREAERAEGGAFHEGGHRRRRHRRRRPRRRPRPRSSYAGPGWRPRGAGRWWSPSPTPTISTRGQGGVGRVGGAYDGELGHLAGLTGRLGRCRAPRAGPCRGRRPARRHPGRASDPSSPGSTGTATTAAPTSRDGATSLRANWAGKPGVGAARRRP